MFTPTKMKKYLNEIERFIQGRKVNLSIADIDYTPGRYWAIAEDNTTGCKHRIVVERQYCGYMIALAIEIWSNSVEIDLIRRNGTGSIGEGKLNINRIWDSINFYEYDEEKHEQLANRAMELIVCLMQ